MLTEYSQVFRLDRTNPMDGMKQDSRPHLLVQRLDFRDPSVLDHAGDKTPSHHVLVGEYGLDLVQRYLRVRMRRGREGLGEVPDGVSIITV